MHFESLTWKSIKKNLDIIHVFFLFIIDFSFNFRKQEQETCQLNTRANLCKHPEQSAKCTINKTK